MAAAAIAVFLGHGVWLATVRRRRERRIAGARSFVRDMLEETGPDPLTWRPLAALPRRSQLDVLIEAADVLSGDRLKRIRSIAGTLGLRRWAERRCRSRLRWRRLEAIRVLTILGGGEAVVPERLTDPVVEVRAQAAEWVAEHPDPSLVARLLGLLADRHDLARFTVHDSLLRIGSPVVEPLSRVLENGGPGTAAALEVAAELRDVRLQGPALARSLDASPAVRALAIRTLGRLGGESVADRLAAALEDPDDDVRAAAAEGLGRLGQWSAAPQLARALRDPAWEVRRRSAFTLRSLGAPGMLFLRRALDDPNAFAADMARQVLDMPAAAES